MEKFVGDFFERSQSVTLLSDKYDKDFDSSIDFPLHKELLKKVFLRYHNEYLSNYVPNKKIENKGAITHEEIENLIEKTKIDFELNKKQKDCVNAMFEIYMIELTSGKNVMETAKYICDMLDSYK